MPLSPSRTGAAKNGRADYYSSAVLKGPRNSHGLKAAHVDGRIPQWELDVYSRILGQSRLSEKQLEVKRRMETSLDGTPPAALWRHCAEAVQAASRDGGISARDRHLYTDNIDITSLQIANALVVLERKR